MKPIKKLGFLLGYSLPLLIVLSYYFGGPAWTFAGFLYVYLFVPILDELINRDPYNVEKADFEELTQSRYFDVLVYSNVYIQYGLLFWGAWVLTFHNLTPWQMGGLVLSVGIFASGIINVAHELGHRQSAVAQWHTRAALLSVNYMHFTIEHNRGHHVHVATPTDPATSRKNQSILAFWRQTLVGGYQSAWQIEKKRLARENKAVWSTANEMLWFAVLPVVFFVLLTAAPSLLAGRFVWEVPVFLIGQSVFAVLSLECVNYIEHYGIMRREIAPGKYERVNPLHSWNANHLVSNLMLFHLQRHSDHHAFAARPYQVLRHFDESPQLPFGYPVMILMSLVPPLWFSVMNKRLENWQATATDSEHIAQVVKQFA
ncbi:MAG: alkane 1-monooxygenase [Runella slithyformis]|nr:MAG: alkane 1-monooxygenase [Runella slithyformis]TAG18378.1 MAG: alkane 1-monooxygenase [Cytophagales bacterium]TAG37866.1 MAG: alkane 1-monooxygenase [Cytophagia bacterium]TAF48231.1 MAG: alkane 1-monooxygenase [Runella slithyformis]TAG47250.1 MAG: alkane 1-monooxygenase [Runella slithyformis]